MSNSEINSDIRDIAAAIGFLYGDQMEGQLVEKLSELPRDDADRLRRLIAVRQGVMRRAA